MMAEMFKLIMYAGGAGLLMVVVYQLMDVLYKVITKPNALPSGQTPAVGVSRSSLGAKTGALLGTTVLSATSLFEDDSPLTSDAMQEDSGDFSDDLFSSSSTSMFDDCSGINPANGLPMMGCVDIEGNVYGTDSSHDDLFGSASTSLFDDSLSSSMFDDTFSSSFDDSFSSSSMFDD